jgi:hypothetical protein
MSLTPSHKFRFKNKLYSLDASTIDLCLSVFPWAGFRSTKRAIKLHVGLNHSGYLPEFAVITEGKTSDIEVVCWHFQPAVLWQWIEVTWTMNGLIN